MAVVRRIAMLGAVLVATAATAQGATIPVSTTADVIADDGLGSLREAVTSVVFDVAFNGCARGAGADVVELAPGTYGLLAAGGVRENENESGDLDVATGSLRIAGAGMGATVVDASGADRALTVFGQADVALSDLTLRNGNADPGATEGRSSASGHSRSCGSP